MPPPTPHLGIYINRPPQDVFAFVLDLPRTPEWRPRMSGATWTTEGAPGVGSKFRVSAKALFYTFKFEFEVTDWDPPNFFAFRSKQGPVLIDEFMDFFPDGDGCRFSIGGNPQVNNWLMRVLEPLFWMSLLRKNIQDFERLKEIMESGKDRLAPK